MVAKIHPKNPPHTVYLANQEQGKLKIYKPNSKEVRDAMSRPQSVTLVKSLLFTTYTLAKSLGWVKNNEGFNADGQEANSRFTAAFKVLTELLLPEAVSSKELEGITQKDAPQGLYSPGKAVSRPCACGL
jgi:hypothetical protein